MSLILPSYQSGFAPRDYEPAYPSLWQGCVGAWAPLLGPTGLVLRDSVGKNDGVLTGGPTWDISGGRYALTYDGVNDYTVTSLRFGPGAEPFSVSLWYDGKNANGSGGIVTTRPANWNPAVNKVWAFVHGDFISGASNKRVSFGIFNTVSSYRSYLTNTDQIINGFRHYCAVSTGSSVTIYVDGIAVPTTLSQAGVWPTSTLDGTVSFHGANDGAVPVANTSDDIRIYSRVLNESEVRLLASRRGISYEPRRVRVRYFRGFSPKKKLLEAKITSTIPGSYQTGYAPRDGEPVYPELWKNCVGAWSAGLGPSNLLRDNAGKNHGALVNGPTYQVSGGQYALDFDGVDDSVLIGDPSALDFSTPFSIALWVNVDVLPSTAGGAIVSKWETSNRQYVINIRSSSGTFPSTVEFETGSGSSDGGCRSTQAIVASRWVHLVGVYDGSNCNLYWDGKLEATNATVAPAATSRNLYFGRRDDAPNPNYLNAKLDDIRFYNRALSDSEIKTLATRRNIAYEYKRPRTLFRAYDPIKQVGVGKITSIIPGGYHTGVGGVNNEPAYPELTKGLVGGWCPSLGVTGGILRDNSGQGNHGVLTGMDPGTDWVVSGGKYALDFDGVDDYVEYGASSLLGGSGSITLSAHVRAASLNLPANTVISKMQIANDQPAYLLAFLSNGKFYFATTTGSPAGVQEYQSTSAVLPTLTWSHVAVSYTWGTGASLQLYLDGVPVSGSWTTGNGNVTFTGTTTLTQKIGRLQHTGVNTFFSWNGTLDDVRIYNRILSPNEIRLLASRRGIGYDFKTHRSYSKTQSSGLLKRLILTGQT